MVTVYARDMNGWERWQRAYRYGVLLIYPPDPFLSAVNSLRARHDPRSYAICEAHVSLTVPLPGPLSEAQWRELEAIVATIDPVPSRYGPLMDYLPHPGVCLAIAPQDALDRLRIALEGTSAFAGAAPRRYPFSAHMTIAEFASVEETEALMVVLRDVAPQGEFLCEAVSYAVPEEEFRFSERRRLRLGRVG
jgi:2'-5' RNA ligase